MVDMIDTWFLAAACFLFLTIGALIRVIRAPKREDRFLAAMIAVTTGSVSGLTLSIATGTLFALEATILIALLCSAVILLSARSSGGAGA